jgi:hypothetical protein
MAFPTGKSLSRQSGIGMSKKKPSIRQAFSVVWGEPHMFCIVIFHLCPMLLIINSRQQKEAKVDKQKTSKTKINRPLNRPHTIFVT